MEATPLADPPAPAGPTEDPSGPGAPASASTSVRHGLLVSGEEKAREKWLKLQDSRLKEFSSMLPLSVSRHSAFVASIHRELNRQIAAEIQESIQERFEDWQVREKLEQLDEIVRKTSAKKVAWRPSGNPADDQAARDIGCLRRHKDDLESSVMDGLNKELTLLHAEVSELQKSIQENETAISEIIKFGANL
ncbi:unnamed protein product [Sphagnum tenellum]